MSFKFELPKARYKLGIPLRGPKENVVEQYVKVTKAGRRTTGNRNRRIIIEKKIDGVEYSDHATKGWRVVRP